MTADNEVSNHLQTVECVVDMIVVDGADEQESPPIGGARGNASLLIPQATMQFSS